MAGGGLLLVVALVSLGAPKPQGVGAWSLAAAPTPLLGGRLTVRLPAHAKVEARQASIMVAQESGQTETRVVMEAGQDKLVLLVDETFSSAPDGLRNEVEIHVGRSKDPGAYRVEDVVSADRKLQMVSIRHPHPKTLEEDVVRVVAFYVLNPDGLIQVLSFFASTQTAQDLPSCVQLAQKVIATLALGTRQVDRGGGVRELQPPFSRQKWRINLAPGYVLTSQAGPDFLVQRIWKVSPLHQAAPMLGIYVGGHPGFHHRHADATERVTAEPGVMLGFPATWYRWEMDPPASPRVMMELQQPLVSPDARQPLMHLWVEGDTPAELTELKTMAMSMVLSVPSPTTP